MGSNLDIVLYLLYYTNVSNRGIIEGSKASVE